MDATSPEVRTFEIFLGIIPEQVLHVPADESRGVVAGCLEAVDHRRRTGEQMVNAIPSGRRCLFHSLALGDIAPRANHLRWLTLLIPNQSLRIVHPAVIAVLLEKPVLDRVAAFLEQLD